MAEGGADLVGKEKSGGRSQSFRFQMIQNLAGPSGQLVGPGVCWGVEVRLPVASGRANPAQGQGLGIVKWGNRVWEGGRWVW